MSKAPFSIDAKDSWPTETVPATSDLAVEIVKQFADRIKDAGWASAPGSPILKVKIVDGTDFKCPGCGCDEFYPCKEPHTFECCDCEQEYAFNPVEQA